MSLTVGMRFGHGGSKMKSEVMEGDVWDNHEFG